MGLHWVQTGGWLTSARGHATYVDGKILDVTKIDFWNSHEICADDYQPILFEI
jgi:hypothetical protein